MEEYKFPILVYHAFRTVKNTRICTLDEFKQFQGDLLIKKRIKRQDPDYFEKMMAFGDYTRILLDRQVGSGRYIPRPALIESFDWMCLDSPLRPDPSSPSFHFAEGAPSVNEMGLEIITFIESSGDNAKNFKIANLPYDSRGAAYSENTENIFAGRAGGDDESRAFPLKPHLLDILKETLAKKYGSDGPSFD